MKIEDVDFHHLMTELKSAFGDNQVYYSTFISKVVDITNADGYLGGVICHYDSEISQIIGTLKTIGFVIPTGEVFEYSETSVYFGEVP